MLFLELLTGLLQTGYGILLLHIGFFHFVVVATLALACDQGKGVARCGPNNRPGSAIV